MEKTIAVLPGDGIGTEVTRAAVRVRKRIARRYQQEFNFSYGVIG